MKLLFVNQYYWPDLAATSQMLTDLCEHMAKQGHQVHVLCSRGHCDHGTNLAIDTPPYEHHHGVHIHRVAATGFGKANIPGRLMDYASFHALVGLRTLLAAGRYDAIVTLTTPPLIGIYATIVRTISLGRTRHVCWVMDLHPDCEFELGVFSRRNPIAQLLNWLNGLHFRKANRCVALGPHMARRLHDKGVDPRRIDIIPVWGHDLDPSPATPFGPDHATFTVMYSGNAGLAHNFDAVCETARLLRDDGRFVFQFVGGGRRMTEVQAFARKHQLLNIRLGGYVPREHLARSLRQANVHLITLRDGMAGIAVPCKLYGIMAAARPAIFIGPEHCETADAIRAADCGRTLTTGNVLGLVETLREYAGDPELCRRLGENARRAFEQHYQPHLCCEQWRPMLERLNTDEKNPTSARQHPANRSAIS